MEIDLKRIIENLRKLRRPIVVVGYVYICHVLLRRGRRRNDEESILPPEIIMEILSWLPLKPLVKSQLACREWRAVITSHQFMEKHMKRSPCIYQLYKERPATHIRNFLSYYQILDGLILVMNLISHKYLLWNPATRLVLELPDPLDDSFGLTLSCIPAARRYKIVSFFMDKKSTLLGCQVLTLGMALAWRRLTFSSFLDMLTEDAMVKVTLVPLERAVHCAVLIKCGHGGIIAEIITLDVEMESFTLNRLPTGMFGDVETVMALEWNGKLAFCDIVRQDMQLMVLEDYKKHKWCREKEVISLPFLKDEAFKGKNVRPLFGKEGEVWFIMRDEKIFTYMMETKKTVDVNNDRRSAFSSKVYSYKPSFVTFQGMRPDEELKIYRPRLQLD